MSTLANPKISLDQMLFKSLYYRYSLFLTPLGAILVCVLLFYFVVIPQIQSWFALRDTISVDQNHIAMLQSNLRTLSLLNDDSLNASLQTVTNALPAEKDFAGIVTSLQTAAAIAGISLDDYSFGLGDISGTTKNSSQLPVQLTVILKGSSNGAGQFIHQIKNQLPLADVLSISESGNGTQTVTVEFYYAQLPKIVFNDSIPLPVLSSSNQKLLQTLSSINGIANVSLSSPSSTITPTPLAPTISPTSTPTPTVGITPTGTSTGSAH